MKGERILWILVFICIIDSMGFGIMIPLIYSYGKQYGMTKQMLGLLTAAFSVAQFFATPILGTLSDKFGRKVLLVVCLFGTAGSFLLFGLAGSLLMLFAARILDGITGGDISVAQAMVADITTSEKRSKYFGILGSAFGFGYVIGPALGGLLSRFGMSFPFFVSAALSATGAIVSLFFLKETHQTKRTKKAFNYKSLLTVIHKPIIGPAILTGFFLTTAQFVMLIGFQTFCVDKLKLTPTQVGIFYAGFGITGIITQLVIPFIHKLISSRTLVLLISTLVCLSAIVYTGFVTAVLPFALGIGLYGLFNGLRNPMLNAIIADTNSESEQGEVMGINQAYTAMGQAVGPAIAGVVAAISLHLTFWLSGLLILIAIIIALFIKKKASFSS